jgi:hypothetical protein
LERCSLSGKATCVTEPSTELVWSSQETWSSRDVITSVPTRRSAESCTTCSQKPLTSSQSTASPS